MQNKEKDSISYTTKEIINNFIKAVENNNVIPAINTLKKFSDLFMEDKTPSAEQIKEILFNEELN